MKSPNLGTASPLAEERTEKSWPAVDRPIPYQRQEARWRWAPGWKGANSAPERAGFQFLTKDFLRFWMVDIHWEGCSQRSAPQQR